MADFDIKLYKNKFVITNIKTNNTDVVIPQKSFSNDRLLIASLSNAIECLQKYIKDNSNGFIKPRVTFTPMEIINNDFSEAEIRIIQDVAYQSGAREVVINNSK
jgi:hypothetical protein